MRIPRQLQFQPYEVRSGAAENRLRALARAGWLVEGFSPDPFGGGTARLSKEAPSQLVGPFRRLANRSMPDSDVIGLTPNEVLGRAGAPRHLDPRAWTPAGGRWEFWAPPVVDAFGRVAWYDRVEVSFVDGRAASIRESRSWTSDTRAG